MLLPGPGGPGAGGVKDLEFQPGAAEKEVIEARCYLRLHRANSTFEPSIPGPGDAVAGQRFETEQPVARIKSVAPADSTNASGLVFCGQPTVPGT